MIKLAHVLSNSGKQALLFLVGLAMSLSTVKAQSSVDTKIYVNDTKDENTFVVIISNEDYKHEEPVQFAKNDGEVFKIYCQKTLGIPESNISFVPNATLNEMSYEIDHLAEILNAYDGTARAIIYYTGHGMPDESSKEAYLLPVDGYSKKPTSGMSTKELYSRLGSMNSKSIIVFLDACFSGAQRDGKMLASSRGVALKVNKDPVGDNTVVFSAAQGDETAYPYKSQKHGMFTYYVLDKMQQSGGYTTLGELSDYVTQNVKRKSVVENKKSQTPSILASSKNNEWRNWHFASKAAKRFETRAESGATTLNPHPAPTPVTTPSPKQNTTAQRQTTPVQNTSVTSNTPELSMTIATDLVAQGKKEMRAMNYIKAETAFTNAANQGSLEAYYQLGMLYSNSNYEGYNKETATNYFLKAAKNNHVEAMYQTGMMYLGTDNATAKVWLRKASENGHQRAQAQLSRLR